MSPAWPLLSPPAVATTAPGPEALVKLLQSCAAAKAEVRCSVRLNFSMPSALTACAICVRPRNLLSQKFVLLISLDSQVFPTSVLAPRTPVRTVPCFMRRGQGCPQGCLPKGKAAEHRASGSNAAAGKQCEAATAPEASAEPSAGSQPPWCAPLAVHTHREARLLVSASAE